MDVNAKKIIVASAIVGILIYLKNKMNKNLFSGAFRKLSINSPFGIRGGKPHKGNDLFGKTGDKIFVKKSGKVLRVQKNCKVGNTKCGGGWGNFVEIQHTPTIKTLYAHLTNVFVNSGDTIEPYEIIGTLGNTGNSRGAHLHWEYFENGKQIDGKNFMNDYFGIELT